MDYVSSELKTVAQWKILLRGWQEKLYTGRKYSQITYPAKDLYVGFIKKSQNSTL